MRAEATANCAMAVAEGGMEALWRHCSGLVAWGRMIRTGIDENEFFPVKAERVKASPMKLC